MPLVEMRFWLYLLTSPNLDPSFLSFEVQADNREDAFAGLTLYRTPIARSSCPILYLSKA